MLDMEKLTASPEPKRVELLLDIIQSNRKDPIPEMLANVVRRFSDTFAASDTELGRSSRARHQRAGRPTDSSENEAGTVWGPRTGRYDAS